MGVKKTRILILLSKSLCGTSQVKGYSRCGGGAAQVIDFQSSFFKTMNPQSDSQTRTDPGEPNRPALLNVCVAGPFQRPRIPKGPGPVFPTPLEPALGVPQGPGRGDPRSPLSRHRGPAFVGPKGSGRSASRGGARLSSPGAPAPASSPTRARAQTPRCGEHRAGGWGLSPSALAPLLLLLLLAAAAEPGESAAGCAGGCPAFSGSLTPEVLGRAAAGRGERGARRDGEGAGCAR